MKSKKNKTSIAALIATSFALLSQPTIASTPTSNQIIDDYGGVIITNNKFNNTGNGAVLIGKDVGNKAASDAVTIGSQALTSGAGCITMGHDARNGGAQSILIGTNSSIGTTLRYPSKKGPKDMDFVLVPHNLVIGNEIHTNYADASNTLIGHFAKVNGSYSATLGNNTEVGEHGTSLGYGAKTSSKGGVALGMFSQSNRNSEAFGYNPGTNESYENNLELVLSKEEFNRLQNIENRLKEAKDQVDAQKLLVQEKKSEVEKIIATFDKVEYTSDGGVSKVSDPEKNQQWHYALDEATGKKYYSELYKPISNAEKEFRNERTKLEQAERSLQVIENERNEILKDLKSTTGAVSVGNENTKRQITNLAPGSENTDAVNVRQLKDLAEAHEKLIEQSNEQVEQELAQMNDNINDRIQEVSSNTDNRFNTLDQRMNRLDKKMEKGLASQAALNGLFQPYSVGSHNLTMAVGGYKSQQAIAIGTGYRFNRKFAVKAGIAAPTSGFNAASYNVGMNIEW